MEPSRRGCSISYAPVRSEEDTSGHTFHQYCGASSAQSTRCRHHAATRHVTILHTRRTQEHDQGQEALTDPYPQLANSEFESSWKSKQGPFCV